MTARRAAAVVGKASSNAPNVSQDTGQAQRPAADSSPITPARATSAKCGAVPGWQIVPGRGWSRKEAGMVHRRASGVVLSLLLIDAIAAGYPSSRSQRTPRSLTQALKTP